MRLFSTPDGVGLVIDTPRLRVIATTSAMAAAAARANHPELARLLDAVVPDHWPPKDLGDVQQLMADKLAESPANLGWWGWYMLTKPGVVSPLATLVGSCGCSPFGSDGCPMFGYGILPQFEGRGLTSEAAIAVADWAISQPGISRLEATTFEHHFASIKILERCQFTCLGVSPDDEQAAESDRQGRGRLLSFVRYKGATP